MLLCRCPLALIFLVVPAEAQGCAVPRGQPCSVLCPQKKAGQQLCHPPAHCTKVLTTGGIRGISQPKCQHLQYLPPHGIPGSLGAQQCWQSWAVSGALTCAIVHKLTRCTDYHGARANAALRAAEVLAPAQTGPATASEMPALRTTWQHWSVLLEKRWSTGHAETAPARAGN